MLKFSQFIFESKQRHEAAEEIHGRGQVSESTFLHTVNEYHKHRENGLNHEESVKKVKKALPQISKHIINSMGHEASLLSPEETTRTINDSHEGAIQTLNHIHENGGRITAPAIATGKKTKESIASEYGGGSRSTADILIPYIKNKSNNERYFGVSLKYSSSPEAPSTTWKANTSGHHKTHSFLQSLHESVFGKKNKHLESTWESFKDRFGKGELSPEHEEALKKIRDMARSSPGFASSKRMPSATSLIRKAVRGDKKWNMHKLSSDVQKHLHGLSASTKTLKSDPQYKDYTRQAADVINQSIIKAVKNPTHEKHVRDFVRKITDIAEKEPNIDTHVVMISRKKGQVGSSTKIINSNGMLQNIIKHPLTTWNVSHKGGTISIKTPGGKIAIGRSDSTRANPVNITIKQPHD